MVARAAAVGNAVAARQVIVIGAAVPLARRPSLSARTRTLVAVCVNLAHRSFFSRSRRRLTPRSVDALDFCGAVGGARRRGGPTRWGPPEVGVDALLSFLKLLFLFSYFLC